MSKRPQGRRDGTDRPLPDDDRSNNGDKVMNKNYTKRSKHGDFTVSIGWHKQQAKDGRGRWQVYSYAYGEKTSWGLYKTEDRALKERDKVFYAFENVAINAKHDDRVRVRKSIALLLE